MQQVRLITKNEKRKAAVEYHKHEVGKEFDSRENKDNADRK